MDLTTPATPGSQPHASKPCAAHGATYMQQWQGVEIARAKSRDKDAKEMLKAQMRRKLPDYADLRDGGELRIVVNEALIREKTR